jgi:hypothetical protein
MLAAAYHMLKHGVEYADSAAAASTAATSRSSALSAASMIADATSSSHADGG